MNQKKNRLIVLKKIEIKVKMKVRQNYTPKFQILQDMALSLGHFQNYNQNEIWTIFLRLKIGLTIDVFKLQIRGQHIKFWKKIY